MCSECNLCSRSAPKKNGVSCEARPLGLRRTVLSIPHPSFREWFCTAKKFRRCCGRRRCARSDPEFFDGFLHLRIARDVANDPDVFRSQLRCDGLDAFGINGNDGDLCTLGSVGFGAIVADAARTAGQENHFIFEQRRVHGRKKTSLVSDQVFPAAAASGSGDWHGSVSRHHRCVSGSAAIFFIYFII